MYKNMHIKWVSSVSVAVDMWCWHEDYELHCHLPSGRVQRKIPES